MPRSSYFESLESRHLLATFTVTSSADSGAGTLRQAVIDANLASGADVVEFSQSLAGQTITLAGGDIQVSDALTINGLGADRLTLNGGGASRLFTFSDGNGGTNEAVSLSGLRLTNGSAFNGGAINIELGASATITACRFDGNQSSGWGGAIAVVNGSSLTLRSSALSGNQAAEDGGGIYALDSNLTVENCTITGNSAGTFGGGVGAVTATSTSVTIRHSTITANTADSDGNASGVGGGINPESGTWVLTNTIVAGNFDTDSNTSDDASGTRLSSSTSLNNIIGHGPTSGGLVNGQGANQLGVDPLLGPLASNGGPTQTYSLLAGSPAINAGIVIAGMTTDQRGTPFLRASGSPDIGAYERQTLAISVSTTVDESDGDYSQGDLSLREALTLANANAGIADTIRFDIIGTIPLNGTQLSISDAVSITGPGANRLTIDAGNSSRIFSISDGNSGTSEAVVISGLNFLDGAGTGGYGGSILIDLGAAVTIDSCAIVSSTSDGAGGAIGLIGSSSLNISNSTLSDNSSVGDGGAIYSLASTLTVLNSTIANNRAGAWGGGLSAFTVTPTTFTVRNCTISGNTADNDNNGSGTGGGVDARWGSWRLISTIVSGNFNSGSPNADDVAGSTLNASTSTNNIIGNAATAGGLTNGAGANQVGVDPLLSSLGFYGGPTQTFALLPASPALNAGLNPSSLATDQRGVRFNRSSGTTDIGAYEYQSLALAVSTTSDEDNGDYSTNNLSLREAVTIANSNSGVSDAITFVVSGIITLSRELTLSDAATITGNGAQFLTISGADASGVFFIPTGTPVTIASLTLSRGSGHNAGGEFFGGAIYNAGTLTLTSTVVSASNAARGGGIFNSGALTMSGGSITGNTAALHGGGLFNTGQATLTDVTAISSNFASDTDGDGGGIFNSGTLTVTGGSISSNSAPDTGGAIYNAADATATISTSTLSQNSAGDFDSGEGGAIYNAGTLTVNGGSLTENTTFRGGALANSGTATLTGVTISANSTIDLGSGGGIFNAAAGTLTVNTSTLSSNTAATNGGAIENLGAATITGSTFTQNGAESGGAVSHTAGTLTIQSSTFSGNSAQSGGAIRANAQSTLRQLTLAENSSRVDGSALLIVGGASTVTNCTIASNTADSDGNGTGQGAIAISGGTLILHSTIVDNNVRGSQVTTGSDIALLSGAVDPASANNLVGSAGSSGGLNNGVNGNLVGIDARLGTFGLHGGTTRTIPLLSGSPAINAGSNPGTLSTDQRGYNRVGGAGIDIGAFETGVYPTSAGSGRLVGGATDSANAHRVVTVNPDGDVIVFEEGWTAANLQERTGAAKAISDAILWVDPKDNLVYVAVPTSSGLLLFSRSATGTWSFRNLTDELDAPRTPTHGLVHLISNNQIVIVAGVTDNNEIVAFQQTLETATGGGPAFEFTDISGDLSAQGMQTPVVTNLISFVTSWNTWHFAGIDSAGQIHAVWIDVAIFSEWRTDNLSAQYGALPVEGQLAVTLTPWGGINLTALDSAGNLLTTWWVPGNEWLNANLTQSANGGTFSSGRITGYGTPWGGINYIGIGADGEVVGYWWAPDVDVWNTGPFLPSDVPEAHLPTGSLTNHSSAAGTLNIFGTTDAGDAIRMWWEPGAAAWTVEDLTELATPA